MNDCVDTTLTLACPRENAFHAFINDFQKWWPQAYTLSGDSLDKIGIEPKESGLCFEVGPHGFRCDWGRVLVWQPPERLVIAWHLSPQSVPRPNPSCASEIHITFEPTSESEVQLNLKHLYLSRHGEGSDAYREELASEYGWPYILNEFKKYVQ